MKKRIRMGSLLKIGTFMKKVIKNAFIKSLPVMTGYIVLGIALGTVITFDTAGIEFSMTALFVTVFAEQWLSTKIICLLP